MLNLIAGSAIMLFAVYGIMSGISEIFKIKMSILFIIFSTLFAIMIVFVVKENKVK